jgi:hypothetical protein
MNARFAFSALAATALALAGCGGNVVVDSQSGGSGSNDSGSGGSGAGGSQSTGNPGAGGSQSGGSQGTGGSQAGSAGTAIAILGSHLPADTEENGYSGFLALAQIEVEPDKLYVFLGNIDATCQSPYLSVAYACDQSSPEQWQLLIGIPPALQTPGVLSLPALPGSGIDAWEATNGPEAETSPGMCTGAATDAILGNVAITSIDEKQVTLQLVGVILPGYTSSTTLTAEYVASRCP